MNQKKGARGHPFCQDKREGSETVFAVVDAFLGCLVQLLIAVSLGEQCINRIVLLTQIVLLLFQLVFLVLEGTGGFHGLLVDAQDEHLPITRRLGQCPLPTLGKGNSSTPQQLSPWSVDNSVQDLRKTLYSPRIGYLSAVCMIFHQDRD